VQRDEELGDLGPIGAARVKRLGKQPLDNGRQVRLERQHLLQYDKGELRLQVGSKTVQEEAAS